MGIDELHFVTYMELTEKPKHGRVSARAIQVSGNHGTTPVARARTAGIQTDITPGPLPGRFHRAIWLNAHRLNGGIATNATNEQHFRLCSTRMHHATTALHP